jgi:hypothetical protein
VELAFRLLLEERLLEITRELEAETYRGGHRAFKIHDPKTRLIGALTPALAPLGRVGGRRKRSIHTIVGRTVNFLVPPV